MYISISKYIYIYIYIYVYIYIERERDRESFIYSSLSLSLGYWGRRLHQTAWQHTVITVITMFSGILSIEASLKS